MPDFQFRYILDVNQAEAAMRRIEQTALATGRQIASIQIPTLNLPAAPNLGEIARQAGIQQSALLREVRQSGVDTRLPGVRQGVRDVAFDPVLRAAASQGIDLESKENEAILKTLRNITANESRVASNRLKKAQDADQAMAIIADLIEDQARIAQVETQLGNEGIRTQTDINRAQLREAAIKEGIAAAEERRLAAITAATAATEALRDAELLEAEAAAAAASRRLGARIRADETNALVDPTNPDNDDFIDNQGLAAANERVLSARVRLAETTELLANETFAQEVAEGNINDQILAARTRLIESELALSGEKADELRTSQVQTEINEQIARTRLEQAILDEREKNSSLVASQAKLNADRRLVAARDAAAEAEILFGTQEARERFAGVAARRQLNEVLRDNAILEETTNDVYIAAKARSAILQAQYNDELQKSIVAQGLAAGLSTQRVNEIAGIRPNVAAADTGASGNRGGLLGLPGGRGIGSFFRFALPISFGFAALGGLGGFVREAEELEVIFRRLEAQFESLEGQFGATFDPAQLNAFQDGILQIARDTGSQSTEVATIASSFLGAFTEQGPQAALAATNIANEIAILADIAPGEIFNDLIAATRAFADVGEGDLVTTLEIIGDEIIAVRNLTGVAGNELIDFIGRVGPAFAEATGDAEDALRAANAIGAALLQQSAVGGGALSEQFGRIISGFSDVIPDLLDAAREIPELGLTAEDIVSGNAVDVILDLIGGYDDLSDAQQTYVRNLLGGRREGAAFTALLQNSSTVLRITSDSFDTAGTRAAEFARRQETVSFQLSQTGAAFERVGRDLLEAGLGDLLIAGANAAENFADVLNATVIPAVETLSTLLGNLASLVEAVPFLEGGDIATGLLAFGALRGGQALTGRFRGTPAVATAGAGAATSASGLILPGAAAATTTAAAGANRSLLARFGPAAAFIAAFAIQGIASGVEEDVQNRSIADARQQFAGAAAQLSDGTISTLDEGFGEFTNLFEIALGRDLESAGFGQEFRQAVGSFGTSLIDDLQGLGGLFFGDPGSDANITRNLDIGSAADQAAAQEAIFNSELGQRTIAGFEALFRTNVENFERAINGLFGAEGPVGTLLDGNIFSVPLPSGETRQIDTSQFLLTAQQIQEFGTSVVDTQRLDDFLADLLFLAEATGNLDEETQQFLTDTAVNAGAIEDVLLGIGLPASEVGALAAQRSVTIASANIEALANQVQLGTASIEELINGVSAEIARARTEIETVQALDPGVADDLIVDLIELEQVGIDAIERQIDLIQRRFAVGDITESDATARLSALLPVVQQITDDASTELINVNGLEIIAQLNELIDGGLASSADALEAAVARIEASAANQRRVASLTGQDTPERLLEIARQQRDDLIAIGAPVEEIQAASDLVFDTLQVMAQRAVDTADTAAEALAAAEAGVEVPVSDAAAAINVALLDNANAFTQFFNEFIFQGIELTNSMRTQIAEILAQGERSIQEVTNAVVASQVIGLASQRAQVAGAAAAGDALSQAALAGIDAEISRQRDAIARSNATAAQAQSLFDANVVVDRVTVDAAGIDSARENALSEAASGAEDAASQIAEIANARFDLLEALVAGDPVAVANLRIDRAQDSIARAENEVEAIRAQIELINAERGLEEAIRAVSDAQVDLLIAQAEYAGDTVEAARLSTEQAQTQLERVQNDFLSGAAGEADVLGAQAALIRAQASERDTRLSESIASLETAEEFGQITTAQLIRELELLKTIPDLTSDQVDEIERKIRSLRSELGADLQFNLPAELTPTFFEARRLAQGLAPGDGVATNTNTITVNVFEGADQSAVFDALGQAIGGFPGGTFGSSTFRP